MEMEKSCEFCLLLKPIVYCKADAAHLCLSCDAKVHSANALSNRHPRTLVCESCRHCPAFVQCSQHQMFMCHGCDRSQHDLSSQHQRRVISSFMGCPSAKDFAALWGFDLNELDDCTFQDRYISPSNVTADKWVVAFDIPSQSCSGGGLSLVSDVTSALFALPRVGSSRRKHPKLTGATETGFIKANKREDMSDILQQIFDLKRLQLNQGTGTSSFVIDQEETDVSSSFKFNTKWKLHENLDQHLQHSFDLASSLHCMGSPPENSATEPFPFSFSQLDGDAFWRCKSPVQSGQLWPQNMQDLGVCDDRGCFDDFSMPEVDLTFKNIEELFGNEQELDRALLDGKDTLCSSAEKDLSFNKADIGYERSTEDLPAASSVYMAHSANHDKDIDSLDDFNQFLNTKDCPPHSIQPSYSMLSFSRLSAESTPEYLDGEPSSTFMGQQHSCNSSDLDSAQAHSKENVISRHKEKKKIRRNEKQTGYTSRKARSDVKRLVRGQFVKTESYKSDAVNVSRIF